MPICIEYIFGAVLYDAYASSDWTLRFVHLDLAIGYFDLIILIAVGFVLFVFFCFDCLV
jgi:hypothetical protein